MVNNRRVIFASLAFLASVPVRADGLHSSLSLTQCPDAGLSSNFHQKAEKQDDVLRKDKKTGSHAIRFDPADQGLNMQARPKMKGVLLVVTLIKYEWVPEPLWWGDRLPGVQIRVNHNGEKTGTALVDTDEAYVAHTSRSTDVWETDVQSTNHWHIAVTSASKVFNLISGDLISGDLITGDLITGDPNNLATLITLTIDRHVKSPCNRETAQS